MFSRISRAPSFFSVIGDELERGTAFAAVRRFGSGVFRGRPLIGPPPALESLFIAFPGIVGQSYSVEGSGWSDIFVLV
jgi:hypothetical protein